MSAIAAVPTSVCVAIARASSGVEPEPLAARGQRRGEARDIGRPRPGNRADRRESGFVVAPRRKPERRHQRFDLVARFGVVVLAVERGDALPLGDGQVGHRADDRARVRETLRARSPR